MFDPALKPTLTDFLAWELAQPGRFEFHGGEIVAKGDTRRVHGLIVGNLFAALKAHLKGRPCRAFVESMKLQVAADKMFYPDVFVTCDPQDLKTDMVFRRPSLVIEVLSDSTQAYDRGLKFAAYRELDSLQEYVLVDPDTQRVEVFRRNASQRFELHDQSGAAELHMASVDLHLPMVEVFDGIDADDDVPPAA